MSKLSVEQDTTTGRRHSPSSLDIKITHSVIVKLPGLLPIEYSPSELEAELGTPARSFRQWIHKGLPYWRHAQGHLWINGKEFAMWLNTMRQRSARRRLEPDQAYCFGCNQPVKMENPVRRYHGKQVLLSAVCPQCGRSIHRGGRHG